MEIGSIRPLPMGALGVNRTSMVDGKTFERWDWWLTRDVNGT